MHTVHAQGCKSQWFLRQTQLLTVRFDPRTWHTAVRDAVDHCDLLMMMLEMRYCVDRAQWNETQPIVGVGLINVSGLQYGHTYSFRVVAMNAVPNSVRTTTTRSDLHTVTVPEGTYVHAYTVSTSCARGNTICPRPSTSPWAPNRLACCRADAS